MKLSMIRLPSSGTFSSFYRDVECACTSVILAGVRKPAILSCRCALEVA